MKEELQRRKRNSKRYRWTVRGIALLLIVCLGGSAYYLSQRERWIEEDFHQADQLVEAGKYQKALAAYQDLQKRYPDFHLSPRALFQSGEVLNLYLKSYPKALLAYLMVIKDYPDSEFADTAQLQVAEIYKNRMGDYGRAIVAYQKLLDNGYEHGDRLQYEIADTYFHQNNFEQARIEFESLTKNYPDSSLIPEVEYRIAVIYSLEGETVKAEEAFQGVIERYEQTPYALEARFGLATLLEEREELLASLKILEALEGKYPNPEALAKKTEQVRERIKKKKKAI